MLVFTTTFPVSSEFSFENFINLAIEWVLNPKSKYNFDNFIWDKSSTFSKTDVSGNVELIINTINSTQTVAIRLKNLDGSIEWISDFIMTDNHISVQLQRNSTDNADYIPNFHIPYFLKMILENNYGGCDNCLNINISPTIITEKNISIIANIINSGSIYKLPIVYVSRQISGDYSIDANQIARKLAGTAHVLVEKDISVSRLLQEKTSSANPYNGAIQIYYPKNFTKRFIPEYFCSQKEIQNSIISFISERNLQMKIDEQYQYYYVTQRILNNKRLEAEKKHKQSENDIDSLTEMYDALENQYQALKEEKEHLSSELNDSKAKNIFLQDQVMELREKLNHQTNNQNTPLIYHGDEPDLYTGEQYDILLDVLTDALNKIIPNDTPSPRRRDIINSILERNKPIGELNNKLEVVDQVFKHPKLTKQDITELQKIGLCLTSDKNHYKFTFMNKPCYYTTVAKTASDTGHGNKNTANQIKKSFF